MERNRERERERGRKIRRNTSLFLTVLICVLLFPFLRDDQIPLLDFFIWIAVKEARESERETGDNE